LIAFVCNCLAAVGQTQNSPNLKELADQRRWGEIVASVEAQAGRTRSADSDYYLGIALAQLGRLNEAERVLEEGHKLQPGDPRFPPELGGVAFQQKQYGDAARWVRKALRIDPNDAYANELLATVYFLQGNLDAALAHWNRIGKPQIEQVKTPADLKINPALLDRAFTFSPASVLRLNELRSSEKRIDGVGVFAQPRLELEARDDGKFDIGFRAQERNGFGPNLWWALLSTFRGVAYETVYPEYFNLGGKGRNIESLLRWDSEKRRIAARYSSPLRGNPKYRYQFGVDLRNENWVLISSFTGPATVLGALKLRAERVGGRMSSFASGRWDWSVGAELSDRQYRNVDEGSALGAEVLLAGYQLKQVGRVNYELWRNPDRRIVATSGAEEEIARIWSDPAHLFEKIQGTGEIRWFPQMKGDDYAMVERLRAGKTFGDVPFDELYMLGLERDNDLLMRAHIGTRDGRKGSAPLGRTYFVSNWEIDKKIYDNGFFSVKLSPFLDTGKITDSLPGLGSQKWLWDTGVQAKFSVLGVGFAFTYGKDLRSGNNAFYFTAR
jgi:tetratricopeptide (TPR) repeat protein